MKDYLEENAGWQSFIPTLNGDFDNNGVVDGLDFLLWQRDSSVGSIADWEANYGMGVTLSAISTSVPEPSTAGLWLCFLCLLLFYGHSHGHFQH